MKIIRISRHGVKPVNAIKISYKGKEVYNVKHGSRVGKYNPYSIGVNNKTICADFKLAREELDGDGYVLKAIMNHDREQVTDTIGNKMFYLDIDDNMRHTREFIVLIEPSTVKEGTVKIVGEYTALGHGIEVIDGEECNCLVIHVTGNTILSWPGDVPVDTAIENGRIRNL